ncbi:MAG: ABC transporter substrate-binding protein [Deltaproteobacteria bacterium]|nr:ABC transporter substrate-binding protein [Deltaproteobacteria bacterium]
MTRIGTISAYSLLTITLLAGCGSREVKTPPDKVTVQLKWVHQAQFAGLYMAQEKGYYAGENIKVTFVEGGPGIDTAEQVITKKADFGV